VQVIIEPTILGAKFKDGPTGMQYRGVVSTTKSLADFGQAVGG
jgi:hypothetical protein